jgi:hypothetical protein
MFVAVAAAGMLASCSSDSLTAGPDPKIEPTQEDLVPIEISVATPMARSGMTRGTGTVGGVEDGNDNAVNNDGTTAGTPKTNIWAGQKINVYMFKKGSLNIAKFKDTDPTGIFDNAVMDTPKASENKKEGRAHYVDPAVPATNRYLEKYYPLEGVYDFWGYRIDDATVNSGPAKNATEDLLSVNITVDGTQDVLGAKTVPATWENLTTEQKDQFDGADDAAKKAAYNAYIAPGPNCKLYSASSARKKVQPRLEFNHLMTRLTFEAYPGNDNAKTVYVTGVKVRALSAYNESDPTATRYINPKGTLDIAGTSTTTPFEQKITWETNQTVAPAQFTLMERASIQDKTDYTAIGANEWYSQSSDASNQALFIDNATFSALPASGGAGADDDQGDFTALTAGDWYSLNANPTNPEKFITSAAYGVLPATDNGDPDGNKNLVALNEVAMDITPSNNPNFKRGIGEAIIAPNAQYYELEIDLKQKVAKYEDSKRAVAADWDEYTFNVVKAVVRAPQGTPAASPAFEVGKSYDFVIKVYGLEKIEVIAVLKPWEWQENINVVTE